MIKTAFLAAAAFALSGCVVAIGPDGDWDGHHDWDDGPGVHEQGNGVTVEHADGEYHRFDCPVGYVSFYEETDDGKITYGCKEKG